MSPSRSSYDNIKRWKVVRSFESYEILPSPNYVFSLLVVTLPGVALFYWLLHYKLKIDDPNHLLMADAILFGTSFLLLIICLRTRFQVGKDRRPILVVNRSRRELILPRLSKSYPLGGSASFFVAHDYFEEFEASELTFVEEGPEGPTSTLLLHFLGRYREFDKIGKELAELGVPFKQRDHRAPDED